MTLRRKIQSDWIVLCVLLISSTNTPVWAATEQPVQCQTSPNVQSEIMKMSEEIGALQARVQNKCGQGIKSDVKQIYYQFLGISVSSATTWLSIKNISFFRRNHALSYDLKLYEEELNKISDVAKTALQRCDADALSAATALRAKYTNYFLPDEASPARQQAGYQALRQAERATTNAGEVNYFYQDNYYGSDSAKACDDPQLGPDAIVAAFKNFRARLKNMWAQQKQIKPRSGQELYEEFLADQGLITLDQAKQRLQQGHDDSQASFLGLFEDIWTKLKGEVKRAVTVQGQSLEQTQTALQQEGYATLSQEQIAAAKNQSDVVTERTRAMEERRATYKLLYNTTTATVYSGMESALAATDNLIVSQQDNSNKLCMLAKRTADRLSKFCQTVVANKGGVCDDVSQAGSACK